MKITGNIETYLDGGTIGIKTNKGEFFIDRRIGTKTPNALYLNYPDDIYDLSGTLVKNPKTKDDLIKALVENWDKLGSTTDQALKILRGEL